eukprot:Clim_evm89s25 gene=Clim_evmTU89s25
MALGQSENEVPSGVFCRLGHIRDGNQERLLRTMYMRTSRRCVCFVCFMSAMTEERYHTQITRIRSVSDNRMHCAILDQYHYLREDLEDCVEPIPLLQYQRKPERGLTSTVGRHVLVLLHRTSRACLSYELCFNALANNSKSEIKFVRVSMNSRLST